MFWPALIRTPFILKAAVAKLTIGSRPITPGPVQALAWLSAHESPSGGILMHSRSVSADQAVTGALIPTFLRYGERDMATRCAHWLIGIQQPDGGYTRAPGVSCTFSTGEVLRGLVAVRELVPGAVEAARRAADYLDSRLSAPNKNGGVEHADVSTIDDVRLSAVASLFEVTNLLQCRTYQRRIDRCMAAYRRLSHNVQVDAPTHILANELEALIRFDGVDLARSYCDQVLARQTKNGSVSATPGVSWVSSKGLAQLALCWYELGHWEPADKALAWLERHQRQSGGMLGSYGWNASYFSGVELAWTMKWYLEAHRLSVCSFMERYGLPSEIDLEDGRVQAVLRHIQPNDRVIEVGCGKGRFLKAICRSYPGVQCTGVDIVPALLSELPAEISALEGSLESVPCPDNSFDIAFSVEAIEHSANVEAAIRELSRITRPGGWVVIIDKQLSHWGQLECPSWERWPEAESLAKLLGRYCDHVRFEPVGIDGQPADGMMLVWCGQKRATSETLE
jgi:malonyl-CoA O-methyltransferase